MPLNLSAAHLSRITKRSQRKIPLLIRSKSSPLHDSKQCKSLQRTFSKPEASDKTSYSDSEETCVVKYLAADLSLRDVAQTVQYIRSHMFDAIPENGGFNSTRIAEILNIRRGLPPTVTVAHVHALLSSPTVTEREIAELSKIGIIRRVSIPERSTGCSSVGEGLILLKDIEKLATEAKELGKDLLSRQIPSIELIRALTLLASKILRRSSERAHSIKHLL